MQPRGWMLVAMCVAFAISLSTASGDSLSTNGKFNGSWNVAMTTEKGICDRNIEYGVAIQNGAINTKGGGDGSVNLSGRVDGGGRVEVLVVKGSARAAAIGQLRHSTGSGTWQLPTLGCAGRWSAARL